MFTFDVFPVTPTKRLAVQSPYDSYQDYCGDIPRGRNNRETLLYFNWFNFLSVGIVDISFQSAETGKHATPTRHLNFHFEPLAVSYELFPRWNQRQSDFFSIEPNSVLQFTLGKVLVSSGKSAAKQPLSGLFWDRWHMLHKCKQKELKSDNRRKLNKIKFRYDQVHWWSLKHGCVSTAGASTPDTLNCWSKKAKK